MSMHAASDVNLEKTAIPLWPEGVPEVVAAPTAEYFSDPQVGHLANVHAPALLHFPPAESNGRAVIVCPGGGYHILSITKEGRAVAEWLNGLGFHVFVLKYRLKEYRHPAQLRDVTRAVRLVRSRALEWGVNPKEIGIIGFSAGGHLASMAATLFDSPLTQTGNVLDKTSARPDWAALIYPVITMESPFAHVGSRTALLGEETSSAMRNAISTDAQVSAATPPIFLLHATDDKTVPIENAHLFLAAAKNVSVPAEFHLMETGGHGFGLGGLPSQATRWTAVMETWLRKMGRL
ncbi:alpha/beta hydrolase [Oleiharenicola lentus]|uniref:alpha/beta hydrolase n=1 Tax=Oleiharenicola lentus TaxID=2508720 RepID=UPI003F67BA9F